ncbi:31 kDa ribonucleoprotein, chloroplastic-like [Cucurbita pepo subsp. pepo]|uniref:31 kDa ribonucleoprotein, chloroplastic-like n=1 Tax=Cucurbita pepo subsp. pepo TaxID=3664 RepID=UPI000C9D3083|nr:31 kDa ribonucleoprotein, chloroplastic-like [Cucurbita pepo subsp. pepo]
MASISAVLSPTNLIHSSIKPAEILLTSVSFHRRRTHTFLRLSPGRPTRLFAALTAQDSSSVAERKLYVGNIPRNVDNEELKRIVEEHGAVEKAEVMYDKYSGRSRRFAFVTMKTVDDANAAIEKLNEGLGFKPQFEALDNLGLGPSPNSNLLIVWAWV